MPLSQVATEKSGRSFKRKHQDHQPTKPLIESARHDARPARSNQAANRGESVKPDGIIFRQESRQGVQEA